MKPWLLPDNVSDILPSQARRIEELRRQMLDRFQTFGYELVVPPLIEYIEGLLSAAGRDLEAFTLHCIDPLTGRVIGLRADMTPQVARIDAHLLNRQGVTRLCYCGSALLTRPRGLLSTREPIQIGAELYGHQGMEADIEIIELMWDTVNEIISLPLRLDLTHVGIIRSLLADVDVSVTDADTLFGLLDTKDNPALQDFLQRFDASTKQALSKLPLLYGGVEVIAQARQSLPKNYGIQTALDELSLLIDSLGKLGTSTPTLSIDLADVRGYHYHSGIMFGLYTENLPNALVRGGRYDNVGVAFGRARAATGFSLDLRTLSGLVPDTPPASAIKAPWSQDKSLRSSIAALRARGEIVLQTLPGHEQEQEEFFCDRVLVQQNGVWCLQTLVVSDSGVSEPDKH